MFNKPVFSNFFKNKILSITPRSKDNLAQTEEISRLQLEITNLTAALSTKTTELEQSIAQSNHLQTDHKDLLEKYKSSTADSEFKLIEFESINYALRKDLENLTTQLTDLRSGTSQQCAAKELDIEQLKTVEQSLNDKVIFLKNELTLRDAIVANYDGELKDLISEKEALDKRYQELMGADEIVKNQLSEKCDEIQVLKYTEIAMSDEHEKLIKRQQELEAANVEQRGTIENLHKSMNSKSTECTELEQVVNKIRTELKDNQQILTERAAFIGKLESEATTLQCKCNEITENLAKSENQRQELIASLNNDKDTVVNELNCSLDAVRTELAAMTLAKTNVEVEVENRDKIVHIQKSTIEDLEAKYLKVTDELSSHAHEIESLKKAVNLKEEYIQALDEKLLHLTSANELVRSEIILLGEQIVGKDQTIANLQGNVANLESEIVTVKEARAEDTTISSQRLQEISDQLVAATAKCDGLTNQIETVKQSLTESKNVLTETASQLEVKSKELTESTFRISQLDNELVTRQADVDRAARQNEELVGKLESANKSENDLQIQLSKLEIDHADLGRKMTLIEQKVEQVSDKHLKCERLLLLFFVLTLAVKFLRYN